MIKPQYTYAISLVRVVDGDTIDTISLNRAVHDRFVSGEH